MAKKVKRKRNKNAMTKTDNEDNERGAQSRQSVNESESDDNYDDLKASANKKKKKSGGFQSMALSYPILKAVLRKGYKVPTPIQRKTIPLIMEGRDMVAMARTGSGKTAAFLVPLLEKLRNHSVKIGCRAIILSPTRELALQTLKFTKELSRFTDLKSTAVLGGDSMDKQFAAIHDNPDIIIASPGRLLHVIIEMDLKLASVEYVVFDEADRLFEMGFQEQLNEILHRLPQHKQTLLFSATLPQLIVDFTKAGLNDPLLVRLDTDTKLSENLKTVFLGCRNEDKVAIVLHLLKNVVKASELTVVFMPTRHHIEYLKDILTLSDIPCSYLYSSLDQDARREHIRSFQKRYVSVLLVTDVAARGVDIPMLDNVINFNFPAKSKLFVHRVGRVARAGREGTAFSLLASDETPFLYSLHLFLNKSMKPAIAGVDGDGVYGAVPQTIIDEEMENVEKLHSQSVELRNMQNVCSNAYKNYLKSRPQTDGESVRNVKQFTTGSLSFHPIFKQVLGEEKTIALRCDLLSSIKNYRPNSTIFETTKSKKSLASQVMLNKRKTADKIINKFGCARKNENNLMGENVDKYKDSEFYLNYQSNEHHFEKGLELEKPFNAEITAAAFDIAGDESESMRQNRNAMKWDRKKKRYIASGNIEQNKKKIKTESGNWISASYKSNLYKKWKEMSKAEHEDSENEDEGDNDQLKRRKNIGPNLKRQHYSGKRPPKRELKNKEEIYKERQKQERKKSFQKWRQSEKAKRKGSNVQQRRHK